MSADFSQPQHAAGSVCSAKPGQPKSAGQTGTTTSITRTLMRRITPAE